MLFFFISLKAISISVSDACHHPHKETVAVAEYLVVNRDAALLCCAIYLRHYSGRVLEFSRCSAQRKRSILCILSPYCIVFQTISICEAWLSLSVKVSHCKIRWMSNTVIITVLA